MTIKDRGSFKLLKASHIGRLSAPQLSDSEIGILATAMALSLCIKILLVFVQEPSMVK